MTDVLSLSETPRSEISPETHRLLAVNCFNETWQLLDIPQRTPEQDDAMLHMAHASRHHWGAVQGTFGTPVHLARGEWQISRVYAELKRPEPALHHARRVLDICEVHGIGDFDLAYAYEALARACAIAGDAGERDRWLALANEAVEKVEDPEDRALLVGDLATIPGIPGTERMR